MFVTRNREQRYTESPLSSLSALFLSLTYTLYFPLQHYWHTHSYTPTPRADAYDTVLSHRCCPLTPPIWKTLLWVCETLLRCKDVIGRHGECVWESLFFTRMEKIQDRVCALLIAWVGQSSHLVSWLSPQSERCWSSGGVGTNILIGSKVITYEEFQGWRSGQNRLGFIQNWAFLFRVCMFSSCPCGFFSGIPVSSHSSKPCI